MDENTPVVPHQPPFEPEPIPDTIADTDINALDLAQPDEPAPVEEVNEETTDDQPEPQEDEPVEEPAEPEAPQEAPATQEEQPDAKEQARLAFEQRQANKAQRNYVQEERQKIRDYEQSADTTDLEERIKIMEAKDYINAVERSRQSITQDVSRAQSEIPFFKSNTEQSQLLFNQSLENFANAYGVTDPESGEWLGAQDRNGNEVQLLPYLQQQAAIYEQAVATAGRQAQQSEAKMRAKAVNPSNAGKVTSSGDELADLLDRIGDVQLGG